MIDDADVARFRAETPSTREILHFNNAGASLAPDPVHHAVLGHLERERAIGGYEAKAEAAPALGRFYTAFAELLNAEPAEMAFIENATRAWDMAFYALPLKPGDRILTHASEYASNYLAFLQQAKRRGLEIDLAPSDAHGQVDVDALPSAVKPDTKLIAITHAPTQGGLINPAVEIGRVARHFGLWYLLDACQSVGQIDVDVRRIGCHILSGTGRKFLRGPRGTGFLYVAAGIMESLDPPFVDLHAATWTEENGFELAADATRFENWECFFAGKIGLARAVDYALEIGMPAIEERVAMLAELLRAKLSAVPGVTVQDQGVRKSGIVTFSKEGEAAEAVHKRLSAQGVNCSVSPMTYARLDLGRRGFSSLVRASVHYFNTEEEIDSYASMVAAAG